MERKPTLALVVDTPGWAFDIAAHIIQNQVKEIFDTTILYSKTETYQDDLYSILKEVENSDVIHFFWRKTLLQILSEEFKERCQQDNIDYKQYVNQLKPKLSTGIYDHLFIEDKQYQELFEKACHQYVVSSKKLYKIYNSLPDYPKPYGILGDTFEKEFFYPQKEERFELKNIQNRPLVIGWVGNSNWNSSLTDEKGNPIDFKGYHTIVKPVLEDLIQQGYEIQIELADSSKKIIPNHQMQDYYNKIDIYLCASIVEGTPKPLLEAMACGVPVITTDVGVAKEVLGKEQQKKIIGERKIGQLEIDNQIREKLKEKIVELYQNREMLQVLHKENKKMAQQIDDEAMGRKYRNYFESFLE